MHGAAQELETALASLAATELGQGFAVAVLPIGSGTESCADQLPVELSTASRRRRASFLAGRACARQALGTFGSSVGSIPIGDAGAPVWPSGFVGSISHTNEMAAAIVVRSPPCAGVGLDIDDACGIDNANLLELICRPEEDLGGRGAGDAARLHHGKLLFVIKEAVYKLHRPLGGAFLEFHDVRVTLYDTDRFVAELVDADKRGRAGTPITGRFACGADWFAAIAGCRSGG